MDRRVLGGADGAERGDDDIGGDVMPHEAKGFQCDFCARMFGSLVDAAKHETVCKFNPSRRRCYTCKNAELVLNEVWYGQEGNGGYNKLGCTMCQSFECKHFGKLILRDVRDIDFYSSGDDINTMLPKPGTCAFWKWKDADA